MAHSRATLQGLPKRERRSVQELLGLIDSSTDDIIFISVDVENPLNVKAEELQNSNIEAGLASLDTKDLDYDSDFDSSLAAKLISAHNFVSGSQGYQEKGRRRFLFGDSVALTQNDMLRSIRSLIPLGREVVFVGHNVRTDLQFLSTLGLDFSAFNSSAVDTQHVSPNDFPRNGLTLKNLLLALGIPHAGMHCGGNDAHFTLRALLLLAVRKHTKGSELMSRRAALLKAIALSPLPELHTDKKKPRVHFDGPVLQKSQIRAMKKKAKRLAKTRKGQSKLWTVEMQVTIRAERAAKRLAAESEPTWM